MDISKIDPAELPYIAAGDPPDGVTSNLSNPPTRVGETVIVICVTVPIMAVALALRLYTRLRVTRNFGADDYLTIAAAISAGLSCAVLFQQFRGPTGKHIWDMSLALLLEERGTRYMATAWSFLVANIFVRTSLLVLYLRLFHPRPHAVTAIWTGIIMVTVGYIVMGIANVVVTVQTKYKDKHSTRHILDVAFAHSIFGVVTDFYILMIPIPLIAPLRLPLGRKLGVCAIFLTGLVACVCAILGATVRWKIKTSKDPWWDMPPSWNLLITEINAGIISGCMPVIFVLCKHIAKNECYINFMKSLRSRLSKSSGREKDSSDQENKGKNKDEWNRSIHLAIPKPTISGLGSWVRRTERNGTGFNTQVDSYLGLESVGDDYHQHLKTEKQAARMML